MKAKIKNNSMIGFTLQGFICKKYSIKPQSETAKKYFKANYNKKYEKEFNVIVEEVFDKIGSYPSVCTTFCKDKNDDPIVYNFILENGKTLSIRTNESSGKIPPRNVGQAGFNTLNKYFKKIYKKEIKDKTDIKKLFCNNIEKCLPIFIENFFDANYIVIVYKENDVYKYELFKDDYIVDMEYKKSMFSFTRDVTNWNVSNTLKYNNLSIAEIQIHKSRTLIFRFIVKNFIKYISEKEKNNETLGITCEKTICDIFNLQYPSSFKNRYSEDLQFQLYDVINEAFFSLPAAIQHTGNLKGERGEQSKCSYDFILDGNKTLSVKSNSDKLVCPPEIGQPGAKTCYLYFKEFVKEDYIDNHNFKEMVFNYIEIIIPMYLKYLVDSDYLLYIYQNSKKQFLKSGSLYSYKIIKKNTGKDFEWKRELFKFSRTLSDWNESNTVYYDGISLGLFQVHNKRVCFKFRFNLLNLLKIINKY